MHSCRNWYKKNSKFNNTFDSFSICPLFVGRKTAIIITMLSPHSVSENLLCPRFAVCARFVGSRLMIDASPRCACSVLCSRFDGIAPTLMFSVCM